MGRGKKVYNKETERARQLNESNKKKYTGEVKQRLSKKIYGEEKTNSEFVKDMMHEFDMESKSSVIMEFKNKHLDKIRDFYFREKEKEQRERQEHFEEIMKNIHKFKCLKFRSLEVVKKFLESFEKIHKILMSFYGQSFPEYYIFKLNETDEVIGFFSREYFPEANIEEKIEL